MKYRSSMVDIKGLIKIIDKFLFLQSNLGMNSEADVISTTNWSAHQIPHGPRQARSWESACRRRRGVAGSAAHCSLTRRPWQAGARVLGYLAHPQRLHRGQDFCDSLAIAVSIDFKRRETPLHKKKDFKDLLSLAHKHKYKTVKLNVNPKGMIDNELLK